VIDLHQTRINTAGAYVCVQGLYPFALGSRPNQGRIPVIRLGGHREQGETGWQCARREVYEETGLSIQPLAPPATYYVDFDDPEASLQQVRWERTDEQEAIPCLVVGYCRDGQSWLSLMYLAQAEQLPRPCSEIHGLLLLDREAIHWLCAASRTLEQYLARGGRALLSGEFDRSLLLEPFIQLRLLSKMMDINVSP
jgi:ADP-ribose pyrophosphatase YjhB (NUDIX family)